MAEKKITLSNLHPAFLLDQSNCFANDRVLYLVEVGHTFQLGVLDNQLFHEGLMQSDVDVLVNRSCNEKAAVIAGIRWEIRASSPQ